MIILYLHYTNNKIMQQATHMKQQLLQWRLQYHMNELHS